MSARPDRYSCQSWNVCAKVILQPFVRKHGEVGDIPEESDVEEQSVYENVSESEVFVTALEDNSTVLETCQEDISDHSVSETATISDTLVHTDNIKEVDLESLQDSDSSRTFQIAAAVSEQLTSTATLPKAILDMCDQATSKLRNSLLCENLAGDVNCESDVERLNKIIHEEDYEPCLITTDCEDKNQLNSTYEKDSSLSNNSLSETILGENNYKRECTLDSSSSNTIMANESSLSETMLAQPVPRRRKKLDSSSVNSISGNESNTLISTSKKCSQIKESQPIMSETVCNRPGKIISSDFSSSETLFIDDSLSETLLEQTAPKRRKKLDSSCSDIILVNESTAVEPSCLNAKQTKPHRSTASETLCNILQTNQNQDISCSETLCIDESLSETVLVEAASKKINNLKSSSSGTIMANESFLSKQEPPNPAQASQTQASETLCNDHEKKIGSDDEVSDTVLAESSSLNKVKTGSADPGSANAKSSKIKEPQSALSGTLRNNLCKIRNSDLSSTDTLCIDESMSESVVSYPAYQGSSSISSNSRGTETSSSETNKNISDESGVNENEDSEKKFTESVTIQNFKSQDVSDSKILNVDNSISSDTIMDTLSELGTFSNKIRFGKRPKSALFNKIKNRYENNSSANEEIVLDVKRKPKRCLITNQVFLNNQEKTNVSDEVSKSKAVEGKKETNLKTRHSGVIDKLNSFYKEKMGDDNEPLTDKEKESTNNRAGGTHERELKEVKTKETENKSQADKLHLISNSNTKDHKTSQQTLKHKIENYEDNKNVDDLSHSPNESLGLNHGICREKIEDQSKTKPDNNEVGILPSMNISDKKAPPYIEKKDIISKFNPKGEHNIDKEIKKDSSKINQNIDPTTTKVCKKYDQTIHQEENNKAHLENIKKSDDLTSEPNEISKYTNPEANKKDMIIHSDKQVNGRQYDEVCSISTSHVESTKQEISPNSKDLKSLILKDNTKLELQREIVTDEKDKKVNNKEMKENPFGHEIINPFDDWAMASPRKRLKTPTSNARRDLIGGVNKNQIFKNISEASAIDVDKKDDVAMAVDVMQEPIQTPKRREKIVSKRALAESHIYEEIGPFKQDILADNDTPEKALHVKDHIYDELAKPGEDESSKDNAKEQTGILGRIKNFMFRAYTAVTPWWVARKVYWKKEKVGEEVFYASMRRNSRTKNRAKTKLQEVEEME